MGLLQEFMQEMVKLELESGPEDGREEVGKNCLGGKMAGTQGLIGHVGDRGKIRSTAF